MSPGKAPARLWSRLKIGGNCAVRSLIAASACLVALAGPALAEQPPKPTESTVPGKCEWVWKTGGGLGVWTERCTLETGVWGVTFDEKLGGFVLTVDGADPMTVLQPFSKAADADVSAILPELVKRGYVPETECIFAPADTSYIPAPPTGQSFYEIVPTGARLKAFEALPSDEVPDPPCGDYGMAPDGLQYFMTEAAHPDRVVYVNLGQDGTMFDPKTITLE